MGTLPVWGTGSATKAGSPSVSVTIRGRGPASQSVQVLGGACGDLRVLCVGCSSPAFIPRQGSSGQKALEWPLHRPVLWLCALASLTEPARSHPSLSVFIAGLTVVPH